MLTRCPYCNHVYEAFRFWSVPQLAVLFGVAESAIRRWQDRGPRGGGPKLGYRLRLLKGNRTGRLTDTWQLLQFLEANFPDHVLLDPSTSVTHAKIYKARQRAIADGVRLGRASAKAKEMKQMAAGGEG